MKALTPAEIGAALVAISLIEAVIFGLVLLGILTAARDAVEEDRRRAKAKAEEAVERMARRRVREILCSIRFVMPVTLINESDIDWGEGGGKAA